MPRCTICRRIGPATVRAVPSDTLGILLISGGYDRAHYAFVLAAGGAAIGRNVVLFATNDGCGALLADLSVFAASEAATIAAGVASLATLRSAAAELGVRMIACEAGLRLAGLRLAGIASELADHVELAGVATFLEATRHGQLLTL